METTIRLAQAGHVVYGAGQGVSIRRLIIWFTVAGALLSPAVASAAAPTPPSLVGSKSNSTTLAGTIGLAVSGNYAYTTAYWPGQLTVVDESNPTNPTVVASTPATSSMVGASQVNIFNTTVNGTPGTYAFVAAKNENASTSSNDNGTGDSLTVVNVSAPTAPTVAGVVRDTAKLFGAYGVAVSGHYAYVAAQGLLGGGQPQLPDTSTGSFSAIDLNNLAGGVVTSISNNSLTGANANALDHATAVSIQGNYAYVTAFNSNRLTVIDISNPASPVIKASLQDSANLSAPNDVVASGNYAYVDNQSNWSANTNVPQLTVVNISNPLAPKVVGSGVSSPLLNNAYRVRLQGDFAYVTGKNAASLGVVDIANPLLPRLTATVTSTPNLNQVIGVGVEVIPPGPNQGAYAIVSSPRLSNQANVTYPPYPAQGDNSSTGGTGTVSAVQLDPTPISVAIVPSSEPTNPTTSTSASFTFGPSDQVYSVQCSLDSAAFGPCSSAISMSYTSLSPGPHTFAVQVTDASGNTAQDSYSWTIQGPAPTAPKDTGAPQISGAVSTGKQLTASPGTWTGTPAPTFAYQWQNCSQSGPCHAISGATSTTYTPSRSNVGSRLDVLVTGTNSVGSTSVSTPETVRVTGGPLSRTSPLITGTTVVGKTLTGKAPAWSGYPVPKLTHHWSRCKKSGASCVRIAGATRTKYKVPSSALGFTLRFVVDASNSVGRAVAQSKLSSAVRASRSVILTLSRALLQRTHSGKTSLTVTIKAAHGGASVGRLVIGLPSGLRLSGSAERLARALRITGAHNGKLRFKDRLQRRSLSITFSRPQAAITITLGSPVLGVPGQFPTRHTKKPKIVTLTLTGATTGVVTHPRLTLQVKEPG